MAKKKPPKTLRWPEDRKRKQRGWRVCRLSDCDRSCGLSHPKLAVEKPDPTGLDAANVRTTGRPAPASHRSARIVRGGLPGLGKR